MVTALGLRELSAGFRRGSKAGTDFGGGELVDISFNVDELGFRGWKDDLELDSEAIQS